MCSSDLVRSLRRRGVRVRILPHASGPADLLSSDVDGIVFSPGPGDPARLEAQVGLARAAIADGRPVLGICLGHQVIGRAAGAETRRLRFGHHGANHPVKDLATGKVEITSMNHGFAVDPASLPKNAEETHRSLFDGSNCGLRLKDKPVFSVQYHPEASPGPQIGRAHV